MEQPHKAANDPKPVAATVNVTISADRMQALVFIEPPKYSGPEANAFMIDDALLKAHVTFGLDMRLLQSLREKPVYSKEFPVAKGIAPKNGTDGSIRYLFNTAVEARPKVGKDGSVDYRDLGLVKNVRAGAALAQITLPTPGTEGMAVTGEKLMPVPGKPVPSPVGRGTHLNADGTQLLATTDGHVSQNGARVEVSDTFIVPEDVDTSTGNIKSVRNVSVLGSVLEGFTVEAEGNIEIGGSVEGGSVKAGGNIVIRRGIVGMSRSKIECKGNLTSTFFENCEIVCGGNVKTESSMNSNVTCSGRFELGGPRARIMGGAIVCGEDIIANSIGTPSNLYTELTLGADPTVIKRYTALADEIKSLGEQIEKLRQIIDLLGKYQKAGMLPASKKRLLEDSEVSRGTLAEKLQKSREEYASLGEKIQNSGKGRIVCRDTLYRGVKITIGFATMKAENDITSSAFTFADGKIAVTPTSSY